MAGRISIALLRRTPLLAVGFVVGAGCSLALNLDDQVACTSDEECVYSSGQGQCLNGFCSPDAPGDDGSGGATTMPMTDDGTSTGEDPTGTGAPPTTDDSTSTAVDDTVGVQCVVNTDCPEDERCKDGACVSLLSKDCQILRYPDDVDRDNVVYFGSIMPTSGIFTTLVTPLQNATQLAFDDFNEVTTLQGGREVAWVGCNDSDGADQSVAAAQHLIENVGVPAIIGPIFSESVHAVAEEVAIDAGVFLISPTASAESISSIDDPDNLIWRVTPRDIYQINGFIDRLLDPDVDPARLLVLYKDDAYGNGLFDGMQIEVVQGLPDIEIHTAAYQNPADFGGDQQQLLQSYGLVLGEAFAQPGIAQSAGEYNSPDDHYTHVVVLGTSEMEALVASYASIWAQAYAALGAPLPRFIVSHGAVPQMELTVENLNAMSETLGGLLFANIEGITPNIFDEENFTAFNIRYKIAFMNEDALTSSSLSYDATLAAFFAAVTVPSDDPITGVAIANGMASLNDASGTYVSFGGAGLQFIQTARNALASGNTVDLQGVSGALDWDPESGELRADLIGWGLTDTPDAATLEPQRQYLLNPEPATDGTWVP